MENVRYSINLLPGIDFGSACSLIALFVSHMMLAILCSRSGCFTIAACSFVVVVFLAIAAAAVIVAAIIALLSFSAHLACHLEAACLAPWHPVDAPPVLLPEVVLPLFLLHANGVAIAEQEAGVGERGGVGTVPQEGGAALVRSRQAQRLMRKKRNYCREIIRAQRLEQTGKSRARAVLQLNFL